MPDLIGPTPALDAAVVTRYTGLATKFWGSSSDLSLVFGFDDMESGIKSIRAGFGDSDVSPISGPRDIEGIAALPVTLPISATERHAIVNFAGQAYALRHNKWYYLHVCAEDYMDHVVCSSPHLFFVDLTPPVCKKPQALINGRVPPPSFSVRAGYAGRWDCTDPESGVAVSSWMAYGDNEPLLTRTVKVLGGQGSRAITIPQYYDGAAFMSCVTASNAAELYSLDICSDVVKYDSSPPIFHGGLHDKGSVYRPSASVICSLIPPSHDRVSGVQEVTLGFFEQFGNTLIPLDEPMLLSEAITQQGGNVCRNVTTQHGRRYRSRIVARNGASPSLMSQLRSQGFRTDDTPPLAGQTVLRLLYPRAFDRQLDFPRSVHSLKIRARFSGFTDPESGVAYYDVRIFADGIEIATGTMPRKATFLETPELPPLFNGTVLHAEVRAVNNAGWEGVWSPSADRLLILGSIQLDDPWFAVDLGEPQTAPIINSDVMSIGLKLASDASNPSAVFGYQWGIAAAPCDDEDASPSLIPMVGLEAGLLLSDRSRAFMPLHAAGRGGSNDMTHMSRDLTTSSGTAWASSFQSAGLLAGDYCVIVKACTRPIYASDDTLVMDARCKNATSTPITYDDTPPVAMVEAFEPLNASEAAWPMQAAISCADQEGGISSAYLSLGSSLSPGLVLDALLLNVTFDGNGSATIAQPNITGLDALSISSADDFGFVAEIIISRDLLVGLELNDVLVSLLTCENPLAMSSSAASYTVVDIEPPVFESIVLPAMLWSAEEEAWLLGPSLPAMFSVDWVVTDLTLQTISVCITRNLEAGCDVHESVLASNETHLPLSQFASHKSAGSSTRFFITLTAVDDFNQSTTVDGVIIWDHTPPTIGNLTAGMAGVSADAAAADFNPSIPGLLVDTVVRLDLLDGARDNDMLNAWITIEWEHVLVAGGQLECSYSRQGAAWTWMAHCNLKVSSGVRCAHAQSSSCSPSCSPSVLIMLTITSITSFAGVLHGESHLSGGSGISEHNKLRRRGCGRSHVGGATVTYPCGGAAERFVDLTSGAV